MIQETLVLIKPDGLKKSLTGNILSRLSETKLDIVASKVVKVTKELAELHYSHLKSKPFYESVLEYIQGKQHGKRYQRVFALIYSGENAIQKVRNIAGSTNPEEAEPTTIRGAYGRIMTTGMYENVIHCSGSPEDAEKEIKLWFEPGEIIKEIYPTKELTIDSFKKLVWK